MFPITSSSAHRETVSVLQPVWEGFSNRFQNLEAVCKDHYILMPALTLGIVATAIAYASVSVALTWTALGLIGWNTYQASTQYFSGNFQRGLHQFGETAADAVLLGAGFAIGRAGQAIARTTRLTISSGAKNPGAALHLVDEVAAGILVMQKALHSNSEVVPSPVLR